jgi:hypothetical protein
MRMRYPLRICMKSSSYVEAVINETTIPLEAKVQGKERRPGEMPTFLICQDSPTFPACSLS